MLTRLKIFSIIILLFSVAVITFPQSKIPNYVYGYTIIKNYLPKEYKAHNQNWAITSDNRGIVFFGNSSGVLEFDGINWNLIKIPNGLVRSLDTDKKGTVFVGSVDDLGYLQYDNKGFLVFKSLTEYINIGEPIGHVWHTYAIDSSVFFFTNKRIFQFKFSDYDYANPQLKILLPAERFKSAHKYNNMLYVVDAKEGLQIFTEDIFSNLIGGKIFADDNIYSMLPFSDDAKEILITTRSKGLFIYDGITFKPFKNDFEDFISANRFYFPGTKLPDGTFVLGTTSNGIIVFSRDGKLLRKINTNSGLVDNGVLYIKHAQNKLWLALQNGIAMIDLPSPVGYFNQSSGLQGSVNAINVLNNNVYAATTSGFYRLNLSNLNSDNYLFTKIRNVAQEGWWLVSYKNYIIAASTDKVGIIDENEFKPITTSWRGCYYLYHSKYYPNRIYVGLETGIALIEEANGRWIDRGKIPGINTAVRNIEEDKYGNLWLGTPYSGVYKISNLSAEQINSPEIIHFKDENIPGSGEVKVFSVNNELLFTTKEKILQYNEKKKIFEEEKKFGLNEYLTNSEVIYLIEDSNHNLWISSLKNSNELSIIYCLRQPNGKYNFIELSFLKSVIDFSNSNAVFTIFVEENSGLIWFCGADGIVCFNSSNYETVNKNQLPFSALIRRVTVNSDSILFAGDESIKEKIGLKDEIRLPYNFNSIRFDFSSISYDNNLSLYQYKLEGLDNDWSVWTTENKKDYTNLSSGNYVFRVRAKNIFNTVSNESVFRFSVMPPWYFSWYAFLLYLILLGLIIYSIIQFRVKYLTQKTIKLEAIIADRTRTINQQKEKLQELDELKSRFFTNISHEFRTPLTITLGQLETVINAVTDLNLKKKLEMGYQNAKKLLKLINQLLEIAKIESGKHSLKAANKNIVSFLRHILYNFESLADQKGITLEFYSDKNEINVYFDSEKLDKAFTNLISNAVKFTNDGGKISIQIKIETDLNIEEQEVVEIIIKDTGIGIPKDRLPYIFDRFYQIERTDRSEAEGTGIGLTLTKELIELHSGKIDVESEEGKGTVFKVILPTGINHLKENYLPDKETDNQTEQEKNYDYTSESLLPANTEEEFEKEISNKDSILIIDDNSDIRKFIREQLEENYIVYESKDGLEGIEKANEIIPNLIITDVRMPGMDGFQLSKKIKESTLTSHIPIIILTAKADEKDKLTGLQTGADDYLIKPFSAQELVIRVWNLISTRKKLREKYSKTANFVPSEVTESSIDQKFLAKIIGEINNNISDEKFSAEHLARNCAISVSQLNRKLNALIGQPAGHLIRSLRMEKAAQMLKNKTASIKEVAYSVGYSDQSNFARTFKKHFGKTPGEFIS